MTDPATIFSHGSNRTEPAGAGEDLQTCQCTREFAQSTVRDGILAGQMLDTLRSAPALYESPQDFSCGSLSELIEYIIRTHHDFIREEMPRLHALCERLISVRKWHNPELIDLGRKLRRLSGDLTFHMSHSESKVFPYIEALERSRKDGRPLSRSFLAQGESLIEEVMVGHAPVGEMLRQLEADTHGFTLPEDACPDMISLYEGLRELARRRSNHIQLEGYVLFPRALALEKESLAA